MSMMDLEPRKLDLGRVISQTFGVLGRQALVVFGLTLVLAGLPAVMNFYFAREAMSAGPTAGLAQFTSVFYWVRLIVQIFIGAFLEACLFFVAFSEVSGRKVGIGEVLTSGAKFFLPLFAVNVLSYLAMIVGFILLIVPGIMIAVAWCVAGPALVAERTGITQVFGRSAELTRGNRWRIFGLFLIIFIVLFILEAVLGVFSRTAGGAVAVTSLFSSPLLIICFALVSMVFTAVSYTILGVLYACLRELKEGVGSESLAAVFD